MTKIFKSKILPGLRLAALLGGFLFYTSAHAQRSPFFTSGTHFSFPYLGHGSMPRWPGAGEMRFDQKSYIQITASENTCVRIAVPAQNFRVELSLSKDSVGLVQLPEVDYKIDSLNNSGILLSSTYQVQVVFGDGIGQMDTAALWPPNDQRPPWDYFDVEASALTPVDKAAEEYLLSLPNNDHPFPSIGNRYARHHQFWLHNPKGVLPLSLVLHGSSLTHTWPVDTLFTHSLSANQYMYSFMAPFNIPVPLDYSRGYTGSLLQSLNGSSFLAFGGRQQGLLGLCFAPYFNQFPSPGYGYHDTFEQLKPVNYGDTMHLVAQLQDHYPNLYGILALEDSTRVWLNGNLLDTVQRGYQIDTCHDGEAVITSDKPVLVQLAKTSILAQAGPHVNSSASSSFSITLPSANELMKRSLLKPFSEQCCLTYVVALFTPSADTSAFTLDGQPLPSGEWKAFNYRPGWSWAQVEVNDKLHIMESSGAGFKGYHYSYGKPGEPYPFLPSYGYCLVESVELPKDSLEFHIRYPDGAKESFNKASQKLCVKDTLRLYASAARHTVWQWHFGDGTDSVQTVGQSPASGLAHAYAQPGQYLIWAEDSNGCVQGDSVTVEVQPSPQPAFSWETTSTCAGTSTQLINETQQADSYQWSLSTGPTSTEVNPNFADIPENTVITLTAISGKCSTDVSQVYENTGKEKGFSVPNIFSPNGDGINDCFLPQGTEGMTECYSLTVFNRWGRPVFSSSNPAECWYGRELAAGVYFYVLKIGPREISGQVTLVL